MAQANLQELVRILPENRKHPTHRHIFGPKIFFRFGIILVKIYYSFYIAFQVTFSFSLISLSAKISQNEIHLHS